MTQAGAFEPLAGVPASLLGESPMWHPAEGALYWCDIPGRQLHRWHARRGEHRQWDFGCEPACCAPVLGGGLLLGMRDGLWRFEPATGHRERLDDQSRADIAREARAALETMIRLTEAAGL